MRSLTLAGDDASRFPEFAYLVPLPGPDPWEAELQQRLYPDREFPRFTGYPAPPRSERRVDGEVRTRLVMAADRSPMATHAVIEFVLKPSAYTQAKRERVVASREISLSVYHDSCAVDSLARDMVRGVVAGCPCA